MTNFLPTFCFFVFLGLSSFRLVLDFFSDTRPQKKTSFLHSSSLGSPCSFFFLVAFS